MARYIFKSDFLRYCDSEGMGFTGMCEMLADDASCQAKSISLRRTPPAPTPDARPRVVIDPNALLASLTLH